MKSLKKFINSLNLPKPSEYQQMIPNTHNYYLAMLKGLYENGSFNDRYIQLQAVYRLLVCQFLCAETKIDVIDRKIGAHELKFQKVIPEDMNLFQKYDLMGLDYIYLRNSIHIERLEENQLKILEALLEKVDQENIKRARKLIEDTYETVLAFETDDTFLEIELFPSIYGEGNVPRNAIVFVIATAPEYDSEGNLKNKEAEEKKAHILLSLKIQIEPMYSIALKVPVKILIEG